MGQAPLGLMGALEEELGPVLAGLQQAQAVPVAGRTFWQGQWHGQPLVAVLTGIGKVAAATTATVLIERFGVGRLVFTGVAGGLGDGVRVGDVVVARSFVQHDMDASPLFPRYQVPGYGRSQFEADDLAHTDFARFVRQVAGRYSHAVLSTWLQSRALT